jgi:hypothetical protein
MESAMKPSSDPAPPSDSDLRLARVLAERKDQEGGYSALARAIDESGAGPRPDSGKGDRKYLVDRRKLKSIIEADQNLVLTLKELRALDCYLERFGKGLAYVPLFQKPDLMQTLAESGRVTFLLGSKPASDYRHFSHWDVLAMAEIQRAINPSEVSVRFDIQDVPIYPDLEATLESIGEDSPLAGLLGDQGPSLVCLGSSRTNPAEEAMLCEMFQRPIFKDAPLAEKRKLPFHFVWNPDLDYLFPSHFHLHSGDISGDHPEAAEVIESRDASAVVTDDDILVDPVKTRGSGDTYGVCVAQRRKRGQVWLALAGVTGAATFVAAKLAKSLATGLHEEEHGQDSGVSWAVIKAGVPENPDPPFLNLRQFAQETVVSGLQEWKPRAG